MKSMKVCFIAAIVLGVAGYQFAQFYLRTKREINEWHKVKRYTALDLKEVCKDGFKGNVVVQGQVSCDRPVVSLATSTQCCWYYTRVEREAFVEDVYRDRDRRKRTRAELDWVREMETTKSAVFAVTDKTGATLVDPTQASVDAQMTEKIVHKQLPWFRGVRRSDTNRYRIIELAFLPSGYVSVMGPAMKTGSGLIIKRGADTRLFSVSRKPQEEQTKAKQGKKDAYFWASIASFAAAGLLIFIYVRSEMRT